MMLAFSQNDKTRRNVSVRSPLSSQRCRYGGPEQILEFCEPFIDRCKRLEEGKIHLALLECL